jgi:hypothetical protein
MERERWKQVEQLCHAAVERAASGRADFLALRKEADPDVPILKEAKAEYPKLE